MYVVALALSSDSPTLLFVVIRAGLRDACVEACMSMANKSKSVHDTSQGRPAWTMEASDLFSRCMQQQCAATEPTAYNPEVTHV